MLMLTFYLCLELFVEVLVCFWHSILNGCWLAGRNQTVKTQEQLSSPNSMCSAPSGWRRRRTYAGGFLNGNCHHDHFVNKKHSSCSEIILKWAPVINLNGPDVNRASHFWVARLLLTVCSNFCLTNSIWLKSNQSQQYDWHRHKKKTGIELFMICSWWILSEMIALTLHSCTLLE